MIDVDEARKRWLLQQPTHAEFAKLIADRLRVAVQQHGIWCETSSRAKETHSLVKKLLAGKHTYDSLSDKAGARCIVRYRSELALVLSLAADFFECSAAENKAVELGADRIGYSGIHVQVKLRQCDPQVEKYSPSDFCAELQIRTLGQHLWAEMSHDSFYKNDDTLRVLSIDLKRRAHLMAGLIEVADQEFDRLNQEILLNPEAQLYKSLERLYYKLTVKRPDPALSLEVIRLLLPLYGPEEIPQVAERLDRFFEVHKDVLQHVYHEAQEWSASPFLFQPEVVMIFERLETNQLATRKAWTRRFPESELERIANALGISFD